MFPGKLKTQVICNTDEPIVNTKQGRLRGLIRDNTYIFRGIRYAEAKRFHMPEPVKPWSGLKNAIAFGPVCPEERTPIAHDQYYVPHYHFIQSEECQYLNIWTQSIDSTAKRPVMVWIHGGLFDTGSGIELYAYDGEELSAFGNVVVVSLNHRLNCLGFLDLSKYGNEYKYSGNVGLADIVEALRWIRDNIEEFGGDPSNITLFGQSGGGQKNSALLQTPAADGLFNKIIIQSGMSAVGHRPGFGIIDPRTGAAGNHNRKEDAEILAAHLLENLKIRPDEITRIEKVHYYELAEAGLKAKEQCRAEGVIASWCPTYDGEYYMGDPMAVGFRKESLSVGVIIGSNLGEFSGNATHSPLRSSKDLWSSDTVDELIKKRFGENSSKAKQAFAKAYPDHPIVDLALMDDEFRKGVIDFARIRFESGSAPVYTYMFSLEMPYLGGSLPWHNCEEAYVFHNAEYLEASYIPDITEHVQDEMSRAWISFAEKGNPNHSGMPEWVKYDSDNCGTMIFDSCCEMRYLHDRELMKLFPDKKMGGHVGEPEFGGGPRLTF